MSWEQEGFLTDAVNVPASMKKLEGLLDEISAHMRGLSKGELLTPRAPGKWSKQQVIGHLVDSALNNLKRFCEIQFLPQPYVVQRYQQDELVDVNHYQDMPLEQLLNLWQTLNRQIIFMVGFIPKEKLSIPVDPVYDNGEMKTLGWIIGDYVEHMEHHRKQL
jgi:hypothetical protein